MNFVLFPYFLFKVVYQKHEAVFFKSNIKKRNQPVYYNFETNN